MTESLLTTSYGTFSVSPDGKGNTNIFTRNGKNGLAVAKNTHWADADKLLSILENEKNKERILAKIEKIEQKG